MATVIITSAKEEVRRRWVNQLLQFLYRRKQMPTVNYFKFITSFWVMLCSWLRPCVLGIAEDRRVQLLQHSPKHLRDFWKKKKKIKSACLVLSKCLQTLTLTQHILIPTQINRSSVSSFCSLSTCQNLGKLLGLGSIKTLTSFTSDTKVPDYQHASWTCCCFTVNK